MLTVKKWEKIRRTYQVVEKAIRETARETGQARRIVQLVMELAHGSSQ